MAPEDFLLVGAALAVVANRAYTGTRLRNHTVAYLVVQVLNMGVLASLTFLRFPYLPAQADGVVRLFLSLVVAWHMVLSYQCQVSHRRKRPLGLEDYGEVVAEPVSSEPVSSEPEMPPVEPDR